MTGVDTSPTWVSASVFGLLARDHNRRLDPTDNRAAQRSVQ